MVRLLRVSDDTVTDDSRLFSRFLKFFFTIPEAQLRDSAPDFLALCARFSALFNTPGILNFLLTLKIAWLSALFLSFFSLIISDPCGRWGTRFRPARWSVLTLLFSFLIAGITRSFGSGQTSEKRASPASLVDFPP